MNYPELFIPLQRPRNKYLRRFICWINLIQLKRRYTVLVRIGEYVIVNFKELKQFNYAIRNKGPINLVAMHLMCYRGVWKGIVGDWGHAYRCQHCLIIPPENVTFLLKLDTL